MHIEKDCAATSATSVQVARTQNSVKTALSGSCFATCFGTKVQCMWLMSIVNTLLQADSGLTSGTARRTSGRMLPLRVGMCVHKQQIHTQHRSVQAVSCQGALSLSFCLGHTETYCSCTPHKHEPRDIQTHAQTNR